MASIIPRALRASAPASAKSLGAARSFSVLTTPLRYASVGNVPKPKGQQGGNLTFEGREMDIGELEESEFKIQPLRRVGEDEETMRARLTYQSRKRGILESDLLLSTFADERLPQMTKEEMTSYDLFLDENDWDIYYWATQEPPSASDASDASDASATTTSGSINTTDTSSASYAGGAEAEAASKAASSSSTSSSSPSTSASAASDAFPKGTSPVSPLGSLGSAEAGAVASAAASAEPYLSDGSGVKQPRSGEWAQTIGTFKPAYRPVPARWKDSSVLKQLREHVKARAAAGKGGMAFMPPLRS